MVSLDLHTGQSISICLYSYFAKRHVLHVALPYLNQSGLFLITSRANLCVCAHTLYTNALYSLSSFALSYFVVWGKVALNTVTYHSTITIRYIL